MDRKIEKKRWTPKKIASIAAGVVLGVFIIYQFGFSDKSSRLNVDRERLVISTVNNGDFQEFIPVIGIVIPIKTIYLDAIEGGSVEHLFLEAGNFVNKGDPILKLANTNLLLDIMYREAELFQQSNNLRNTSLAMEQNRLALRAQILDLDYQIKQSKREYTNMSDLIAKNENLIAIQKYEASRDEYEYLLSKRDLTLQSHQQDSIFREIQLGQLETSLLRMEANLEIVKQNLDNLVLKAPVSGQLTSLNAEIGESKNRGERLGQIDVLDGFKLRVSVDEYYISRVSIGQTGTFNFAGDRYQLAVLKVYPEVLNGRFEVDMEFVSEEPEGIRRGQSQHIRLELGDPSEALLLARGGFFQKTGGQWVYLLDKSGEFAVRQSIRLGRQNSDVFEVLEGLNPGDQVITSSYDTFGDIDKLMLGDS
ncbi:MAG: HlyD family efflux transporter periplasmic adaptor subunit [Candidatus Marinimicrobia bacterium]|nr:HlyD family efflux transporter periplasmic adaptor subunit [Candidatus Neomarinimicrobiota bacterium]